MNFREHSMFLFILSKISFSNLQKEGQLDQLTQTMTRVFSHYFALHKIAQDIFSQRTAMRLFLSI